MVSSCVKRAIGPIDTLGGHAGGGIEQATLIVPSSLSYHCHYIIVVSSLSQCPYHNILVPLSVDVEHESLGSLIGGGGMQVMVTSKGPLGPLMH